MASDRMLLALSSPFTVDKSTETRLVKGFMSVELPDRSDELAPAEEFNIASFMAKPTLMYNHKFWYDEMGNSVPIGVPTRGSWPQSDLLRSGAYFFVRERVAHLRLDQLPT